MNSNEAEYFKGLNLEYVQTIGKGCFGVIYKVYSTQYKQTFALKKIPLSMYNEVEFESMNKIDSSRIVRLYDSYKFENNVYLLMELCQTDLLKLSRKTIPTAFRYKYIYEALLAVKVCHDNGVSHNDIKPSNFLVDQYDHVKICDFGLFNIFGNSACTFANKGSMFFLAPEMFSSCMHNELATDVWVIGVSIYFLVTKTYPFEAQIKEDLIQKITSGKYDSEKIQDPFFKRMVAMCLNVDPSKRAKVDELISMFHQLSNPPCENPRVRSTHSHSMIQAQFKAAKIIKPKVNSRIFRLN